MKSPVDPVIQSPSLSCAWLPHKLSIVKKMKADSYQKHPLHTLNVGFLVVRSVKAQLERLEMRDYFLRLPVIL